jgi:putative membrane protein
MLTTRRVLIQILLALFLIPTTLLAADVKSGGEAKLSDQDKQFIKDAASGGLMEVELGKIAAQNAFSDEVKNFGRRMQEDHGKANKELAQLAKTKGVDVPKELVAKHKSSLDRLSKLSGKEFDGEYMKAMLEAHREDLKKFQSEAETGQDPQLKEFAKKHVPILKKHLELVEKTAQGVNGPTKDKKST